MLLGEHPGTGFGLSCNTSDCQVLPLLANTGEPAHVVRAEAWRASLSWGHWFLQCSGVRCPHALVSGPYQTSPLVKGGRGTDTWKGLSSSRFPKWRWGRRPQQHLPWSMRLQHDLYLCVRHWGPWVKGGCRGFPWILVLMYKKGIQPWGMGGGGISPSVHRLH